MVRRPPPLETFVGHYDLYIGPQDLGCEGLDGLVHLSLRVGDSGLEARAFQNFEWDGWPDAVDFDTSEGELVIHPGPGSSLDGKITDDGLRFPYDADGAEWASDLVVGHTTVIAECDGKRVETFTSVDRIEDQSYPFIRERFTTRYNYYPFTWTMFRFSEPIGLTGDSYPLGSFPSAEVGNQYVKLADNADPMAPAPGSFQQWPWGPVAGLVIDEGKMRTGGSVWFEYIGTDSDAAGNPLASDLPFVSVYNLGPLEERHDFDASPPLSGFWPAIHQPPGGGGYCEGSSGCVVLPQYSGSCEWPAATGGPHAFAFRVTGPEDDDHFVGGFRARYRVLSEGNAGAHHMFVETGLDESTVPLAALDELDAPIDDFTHATPWSEFEYSSALAPTTDLGAALSWECPDDLEPNRVIVLEWIEGVGKNP